MKSAPRDFFRFYAASAAFLGAGVSALAQSATKEPSAPLSDTASILFAPKPSPAESAPVSKSTGNSRPVSAGVAADLSLTMPAYKPVMAESATSGSPVESPEVDKPRNQIPRLPLLAMQQYVVRESRLPTFRELDLYTTAGLVDLSFKEHPGLRIGNFFNLNASIAKEMIVDELLLEERHELIDLSRAMAIGDEIERSEAQQRKEEPKAVAPSSSP